MTMLHSSHKRFQAVSLRKKGISLRSIAKKLTISLSTAQLWTKEVVLSEDQKNRIVIEHRQKLIQGRDEFIKQRKTQKIKRESYIFHSAKNDIQKNKFDPFFVLGLALYWAEGFKKDHSLGFVNSDPIMIQLFIKWLTTYGKCDVANIRLRIQIHQIYKTHIEAIQLFWSDFLQIPLSQFQTPFYQVSKSKSGLVDTNYKGMLRVRVVGARDEFIKILGWLDGLREIHY